MTKQSTSIRNRANHADALLLLSIKPEFADRIFDAIKQYELRKVLPRQNFDRVYLYVGGGGGIVGCFDVASTIRTTVQELWKQVGQLAAPKERFFKYFGDRTHGCAIQIKNPIRFRDPIYPDALRGLESQFNAPQSFLYIRPHSRLYFALEERRRASLVGPAIQIRPIRSHEHAEYVRMVTKTISPRYDEITESFARNNLAVHRKGNDDHGILTKIKEVFAVIKGKSKRIIGFTTLTFKEGHSVKTGPTILYPRYRGQGYGLQLRSILEEYVRPRGCNKIYCTCPDNDESLIRHFVRAGYRIEGHLAAHYQPIRGELVLGKVLKHAVEPVPLRKRSAPVTVSLSDTGSISGELLSKIVQREFAAAWFEPRATFGRAVVSAGRRGTNVSAEEKPIQIMTLLASNRCVGVIMLVWKRGGAVKGLILTSTVHGPSLHRSIGAIELQLKSIAKRKLYFVHPLNDPVVVSLLVQRGYHVEAVLEQPFQLGQDALVISTFL